MDIVKDSIPKKYDLVLAHLLLGEALKWGNKTNDLLDKLLMIHAKYFVIVDIKEDTSIDYDYIESQINSKYHLLAKKEIKKEIPQQFDDFLAESYVGYVLKKEL